MSPEQSIEHAVTIKHHGHYSDPDEHSNWQLRCDCGFVQNYVRLSDAQAEAVRHTGEAHWWKKARRA